MLIQFHLCRFPASSLPLIISLSARSTSLLIGVLAFLVPVGSFNNVFVFFFLKYFDYSIMGVIIETFMLNNETEQL